MTSPKRILQLASQTLFQRFPNGLKLDSQELGHFACYFGANFNDEKFLDSLDDAKLKKILRAVGVILDGKVYPVYPLEIQNVVLTPETTHILSNAIVGFFPDGLNVESTDALKRFENAVEALRGKMPRELNSLRDDFLKLAKQAKSLINAKYVVLNRMIVKLIAPFNGVVYPVLRSTQKLVEQIAEGLFDSGIKIVYYSAFFERNKELLVEKKLVSAEFFTFWLKKINSNLVRKNFYFERTPDDAPDEEKILEEIERVLRGENVEGTEDEIIQKLVEKTFVPEDKIREVVAFYPQLNWILAKKEKNEEFNDEEISEKEFTKEEKEKESEVTSGESEKGNESIFPNELEREGAFVFDYNVSRWNFPFTTPISCVYRNEKIIQDCNWRELYCALIAKLYNDYPDIVIGAINRPIGDRNKVDFADEANSFRFAKRFRIAENLYVEALPNAYEFVQKIKRALNLCGVPFEEVVIWCRRSNEKTSTESQRNDQQFERRYATAVTTDSSFVNPPDIHIEKISSIPKLDCSDQKKERFECLLEQYFIDGYKLNHFIYWNRFQEYYFNEYSEKLSFSQEQVDQILTKIGQVREGKVYPNFKQEQKELVGVIIREIKDAFDAGASVVYPQAVFDKFQKEVADELQIYTPKALAQALLKNVKGSFFLSEDRFVTAGRSASLRGDVLRVAQEFKKPEPFDVWEKNLPFVPSDLLRRTIHSINEIISAASDVFFYAPNLPIIPEDVERLALAMRRELETRSFISGKDLIQLLEENCPSFYWDPNDFTEIAVRNSIERLLQGRFTFKGKGTVVSLPGKDLNPAAVFADFARNREQFSYEELRSMSNELVPRIYWESVLSEAIRVSKDEFVRKDRASFDVEQFDEILDAACRNEYMPISEFCFYGLLPDIGIGQKCNEFILESFLFSFSKKFKLIHASFASDDVCGAIVKKSSEIDSYHNLILDVLVNSDVVDKTKDEALNFIVEKGYQKRKKFTGFDEIFKNAKLLKEQRSNVKY